MIVYFKKVFQVKDCKIYAKYRILNMEFEVYKIKKQ